MASCDACGKHENMPYKCRMCGGTFCAEHRLPENHSCAGLNEWNDPSGVFDSGFDDSVNQQGRSRSFGLETGPGGPFGYFRGNMTFVFLALMWLTFIAEFLVINFEGMGLFEELFVLQATHIGRVWTWVTSVFAHSPNSFWHIGLNSIVLYFFGPVVERRIGSEKFTALFLGSGILAGLAQVGVVALTAPGTASGVLGASGAIAAVMGVLTVLNPNLRIYIYFILPMPLWVATLLFAIYSGLTSVAIGPGAGGVAQLAHLAGLGLGLLYGAKLKRDGMHAPQQLQMGGGRGGRGGPGGRF